MTPVRQFRDQTAWLAPFVCLALLALVPLRSAPVFPPLAVLIGAWFARNSVQGLGKVRGAMWVFSATCGVLAVCLGAAVLHPQMARMAADKALALRPFAAGLAAVRAS